MQADCCFTGAKIIKLAAGAEHSLAVSASGELFSWGSGSNGRLGHAQSSKRLLFWNKDQATPKLVKSITEKVCNVSCGHMHSGEVLELCLAYLSSPLRRASQIFLYIFGHGCSFSLNCR